MFRFLDRHFRDDETLAPRLPVIAALVAFVLGFATLLFGFWTTLLLNVAMLVLMVPGAYSVLRALLPLMDPAHPNADPIAVWGGAVLLVVVGCTAFGWMAIPALAVGAILLSRRAPELFEPFDMPDGTSEDPDARP